MESRQLAAQKSNKNPKKKKKKRENKHTVVRRIKKYRLKICSAKKKEMLNVIMVVFLLRYWFLDRIGRFGIGSDRFPPIFIGIGPQESW